MALFSIRTKSMPPSWIISNGHISARLTIYLYSEHRAVIFAIAQFSCKFYRRPARISPPSLGSGRDAAQGLQLYRQSGTDSSDWNNCGAFDGRVIR